MKYFFLLACILSFHFSFAQKKIVKEVKLYDKELQSVIASSKLLRYIEFSKKDYDNAILKPDTFLLAEKVLLFKNGYDLEYPGHQYLFEKQFGKFQMDRLLKILDSLKIKRSEYSLFEGRIYADHIFIKATGFYSKKSENQIFIKVPELLEYTGGQPAFQKYLQQKINNSIYKTYFKNDSAFFFRAVLKRDSLLHEVKPFDSLQSEFIDFMQAALKESPGWKPFVHGGRIVNRYLQIFILIRKDGIVEAGFY